MEYSNKKKDDEDYEKKRKLNYILKSYAKNVSGDVILLAIEMYQKGESLEKIESYLKAEREKTQSFGKLDYYGGRTLREARTERDDDFER